MFSSPFFTSILGKRKEESPPQDESSSDESNDETAPSPPGTNKDEDSEEDEDDTMIEESPDVQGVAFDKSTATMAQLLTRIIPDADIHCSNVIIIGGQSSGKTKMIISMVFHHLIENNSVTDQMGEKLLKLFRTGEKMVTRRPTKICFVKAPAGSPCQISLRFGTEHATFDDPNFDNIVNTVHNESVARDGRAFEGELRVTVAAPGLPTMTFTDLPGLITEDREVADAEGVTIRKLVKRYMRQPGTTLVVVEPAATEDFDTSQVAPMMRDMKNGDRPHVFRNAVLVLSKCDKIRPSLEGRIMSLIDLSSANIADYPFEHVVGVVNKIEDGNLVSQEFPATFAEFRQVFRATKIHEREIFSAYRNRDGAPCDPLSQCTTAAVFNKMDTITFTLVHRSIERGLGSILEKVMETKEQIRRECAPPLSFYDAPGEDGGVNKSGRDVFLKDLRSTLKRLVATEYKKVQLYPRHSYDAQQIAASQTAFMERNNIRWPVESTPGDMFVSQKQSEAVEVIRKLFFRFIEKEAKLVTVGVLEDEVAGCFAPIHSRFHRIDRFPKLVVALYNAVLSILPECCKAAKDAVNDYLLHFWDYDVPKGVSRDQIPALLEQLKHVALRKMFEQLRALSKGEAFDALILDDALLEEDAEFAENRSRLRERWENLHRQEAILERCNVVESNEELRATLAEAYDAQQSVKHTSDVDWLEFWNQAEEEPAASKVVPPSTALFGAAVSPSQSSRTGHPSSQMDTSRSPASAADESFAAQDHEEEHGASLGHGNGAVEMAPAAMAVEEIYHPSDAVRNHSSSARSSGQTPFKRLKSSHDSAGSMDGWASYSQGESAPSFAAPGVASSPARHGVIPAAATFVSNIMHSAWGANFPSSQGSASGVKPARNGDGHQQSASSFLSSPAPADRSSFSTGFYVSGRDPVIKSSPQSTQDRTQHQFRGTQEAKGTPEVVDLAESD